MWMCPSRSLYEIQLRVIVFLIFDTVDSPRTADEGCPLVTRIRIMVEIEGPTAGCTDLDASVRRLITAILYTNPVHTLSGSYPFLPGIPVPAVQVPADTALPVPHQ